MLAAEIAVAVGIGTGGGVTVGIVTSVGVAAGGRVAAGAASAPQATTSRDNKEIRGTSDFDTVPMVITPVRRKTQRN